MTFKEAVVRMLAPMSKFEQADALANLKDMLSALDGIPADDPDRDRLAESFKRTWYEEWSKQAGVKPVLYITEEEPVTA
jgi:hypothetical protein